MKQSFGLLVGACLAVVAALLIVGAVSSGVIRHIVQTLPMWIAIVLGARQSHWAKWAAFPCFVFWLILMTAIWFFLLGWARIVSGTFSPTEIAMTVIVGVASLVGTAGAWRVKSSTRAWPAAATPPLLPPLQPLALRPGL